MKDKTRYSLASKEQWAKRSKEEKSAHMTMMVKKRWATKSKEEKVAHSKLMIQAKINKTNNES